MIKSILKWVLSIVLGGSTLYYLVCKILNINNAFTTLVTTIINIFGVVLNFLAQHLFFILIVIGFAIALWLLYDFIISKIKIER